MTRKLGEKNVLIVGGAILLAGMLMLSFRPVPVLFMSSVVAIGLGVGLATPALTALLSLLVSPDEQGAVHGLNQGATSLGRATGYLLGGGLAIAGGLSLPYLVAGALLIIMLGMTAMQPAAIGVNESRPLVTSRNNLTSRAREQAVSKDNDE
jgi:DHA1 family tetracycline resistance protein-like MFS transporter